MAEDEPGVSRPVQMGDWRIKPLPMQYTTVQLHRTFTPAQMQVLKKGIMPHEMEDKWFVYMQDNTLNLHRSWTGFCVYRVHFVEEDGQYRMLSADVNRNPDEYLNVDDQHDIEMISFLIDALFHLGHANYPDVPAVHANRQKQE
ncbi:hypothetical protein PTSG_12021 [Salpingoeca rosetta]|uniref:Uncharacterized protein n=1 Tax=Salpingoeca rosetta (strain ATCC 50818 / BSB-021) TaxID=946362 RepID=F2U534_SALR5|nr:uncharacterized protein PTSG_12021 [Salpingoeca rosetta]EGD82750.1 hypothetical protein PTSG_12021 [Salpingoeca rosetta]|eukprot:XP_004995986.1 hypothetical protein PTSG_12021 [Salpingoeca rosetta]